MDDYFRVTFEGIQEASIALIASSTSLVEANQQLAKAGVALARVTDAVLHTRDEHEDLRVTVTRLEKLVLELLNRPSGGLPK